MVTSLAREPLVHFVALGALVFAAHAVLGPEEQSDDARASPVHGGPGAPDIVVTPADVNRLREEFRRSSARPPTRDELAELVLDQVGEEMLFREALALGLERTDAVARRCLIERAVAMTAAARGQEPQAPREDELRAWFDRRRHRFLVPERVSFEHVFIDADRHGPAVNKVAAEWLERLRDPAVEATAKAAVGDPSPIPRVQRDRTPTEVAHLFGESFGRALAAAERDRWTGPLSSRRGLHLVRVTAVLPARTPELHEVRADVRADWLTVKRRGVQDAAERLLGRYRVRLPADLARELQGAPAAARLIAPPADPRR